LALRMEFSGVLLPWIYKSRGRGRGVSLTLPFASIAP
jgi:hypothetical protein